LRARGCLRLGSRIRMEAAGRMAEAGTLMVGDRTAAEAGTRTGIVFTEVGAVLDTRVAAVAEFLAGVGIRTCLRGRARWAVARMEAAGRLAAGARTAGRRRMERRRGRSAGRATAGRATAVDRAMAADQTMAVGRAPGDRVTDSRATVGRLTGGATVPVVTATRPTAADRRERRITPRAEIMAGKTCRKDAPDLTVE
jgi:hypothetical protein